MDCGALNGIAEEPECGIAAFATPLLRKPLGGVLKSCPEDFRVRELALPEEEEEACNGGDEECTYMRFTLHKRGVDTLEAIDALSWASRVPARQFGFAGIKDSWAITTQEITVPAPLLLASHLLAAAKGLPHLRVSGAHFCSRPLAPGRLAGNRFLLRLRHVRVSARRVRLALRSLRRHGFMNYIGMQRFGKGGVRSDFLGRAYLQQDYERCVDLLLRQGGCGEGVGLGCGLPEAGDGKMAKWIEAFRRTNCAAVALRLLPPSGHWTERRLLEALRRRQEQIERPGRQIGGADPMVGVVAAPVSRAASWKEVARDIFLSLPRSIRALYAHAYIDRLWNIGATERATSHGLGSPISGDVVKDAASPSGARVWHPGKEDGSSRPSIFDVLLPRCGSGVTFPETNVGALMRSYLVNDGLEPHDLCLEAKGGGEGFWLRGVHRPIVVRPQRLRWRVEWPSPRHVGARTLVLDLCLGPGQYATMAAREVMRSRPPPRPPRHIIFSEESEAE